MKTYLVTVHSGLEVLTLKVTARDVWHAKLVTCVNAGVALVSIKSVIAA